MLIEEDLTLDGNFIFQGVLFDEAVALSHTGSNVFGTQSSDFHIFTGSLIASGVKHEFFGENLVILSASAINVKDLSKEFLNNLQKETEDMLSKENINDQDRYILNHKIDVIKEIRV